MKAKAPFKKLFLARYVQVLEAAGFVLIGLLIAGMVVSAVYEIDDGVKFRLEDVRPETEPVAASGAVWVRSVEVADGQLVEAGDVCARVVADPAVLALVRSSRALREAETRLADVSTQAELPALVQRTAAKLEEAVATASTTDIPAPVPGVVRGLAADPLETLVGQVVEGPLMQVETYHPLRLLVPLSGENAARVRINLLAAEDVLDWRELTQLLCDPGPAPSTAVARVREGMDERLDDIRPGRAPLKRDEPEIVGSLNDLLVDRGFYEASAWPEELPAEADTLLRRGIDALGRDDLIRFNRALLEIALGNAIAPSRNLRQAVKATFLVPDPAAPSGKPTPYPMEGRIAGEPEDDEVLVEFPGPEAALVGALQKRARDEDLGPARCVGSVVVGRVTLFRFLFR